MSLDVLLCLPLVGALAMFFMSGRAARGFGVGVCALQLLLGFIVYAGGGGTALKSYHSWLPGLGLNWSLGLDGANVWLILLCPLLTGLALLTVSDTLPKVGLYSAQLVLLGALLSGLFLAQNLGLFYIFFEALLIPAVILVAGWSRVDGRKTAHRFMMFTLSGSLPMLLGVLMLAFHSVIPGRPPSLEFQDLAALHLDGAYQAKLFLLFIFAFMVKMPIVPLHGWMIPLYRNAPASAVVVIAALMSKAGTYGLIKIGYTIFPEALIAYLPLLTALAVLSILYGAFSALSADSLREVLAFSSLSHIGLIALGIVSHSGVSSDGAVLQMTGHALATGGLFLAVALFEKRGLPDELRRYGGMASVAPRFAAFVLFLTLAGLGQPGLGSFPGELLILTGVYAYNPVIAVVSALGIVLAAMYMLRWYQTLFTGELGTIDVGTDLGSLEAIILSIPIGLSFLLGFVPSLFLHPIQVWLQEFR